MNVFLSYSRKDSEWATALAERLRSAGFGVWDPETELCPGDNFALKTAEALAHADAMVALVSHDAMASEWVRREIDFALGASQFSGRLIPVVVRPTEGLPWIFRKLKPISPEGGPSAAADSVVQALQRAA